MSHDNNPCNQTTDSALSPWVRREAPLDHVGFQTMHMTIGGLVNDANDYDVSAPYQRASVWTDEQRKRLIRSVLAGIPTGAVIVAELEPVAADDPLYRVVDGRQRIEALAAFTSNQLAVPADWFADEELDAPGADGTVTWSGLSAVGQRRFENRPFSVLRFDSLDEWTRVTPGSGTHGGNKQYTVRRRSDAEQLEYEAQVFVLVNTSGTPQTDGDIARAQAIATPG